MHSPKSNFRQKIKPGYVLEGLLDDGLVQYVVDPEGLKLRLTPEGNDFFTREMHNKPRPKVKSLLRYFVMAVFFLFLSVYYRLKLKKG